MIGRVAAFAPVAGPETRLLIVGSLPGAASLAAGQYYAHPRNAFWLLIGAVAGDENLAALPYPDRLAALRDARIGLWDAIATAARAGSLDAAIRDPEAANLRALAARLPDLRAVAFNGATAARIGRRQLAGLTGSVLHDLPSSSPAHAGMPFTEKRARWLVLAAHLAG
jgi:double-stranded uracil-DNA glycosylase